MKYLSILAILLLLCSCNSQKSVKEKALHLLDTEDAVNYSINKLTIQGSTEHDTTFIEATSSGSFKKEAEDSVYQFVVQDSLVHPFFKVPFKNIYHYDGKIYTYALISELKKDLQKKTELKEKLYNNLMQGQLPSILYILQDEQTKTLQDTIIDGETCIHLQWTNNAVPYSLFVSKNTQLPVLLRVVISPSQPFIQEYTYTNFTFTEELIIPNYEEQVNAKVTKKAVDPLKKGDVFPDWEFKYLQGGNVCSITASKNVKVVYLSMINCGACRKALPYIETIYNKYQKDNTVDFFVLYPADSKQKLSIYVEDKHISTPILYNKETEDLDFAEILHKLRVGGYPATIVLNSKNEIVEILGGFSTQLEKRIAKAVEKTE